jgi:hypothetical protein
LCHLKLAVSPPSPAASYFAWVDALLDDPAVSPRSRQGAAMWCGHGVFAHNLGKIGALAS